MTTSIFQNDAISTSWHVDTKLHRPSTTTSHDKTSNLVNLSGMALLHNPTLSSPSDGFLRLLQNQQNLSSNCNDNNNRKVNSCESFAKKDMQDVKNPTYPSKLSVLAGKYLVLPAENASIPRMGMSRQSEFSCVNIQTKEQFICKIVPRSSKGLAILAAYHRLEESSEFVNQVVEAILTPKILYLIMPKNYGNVHSYLLAKRTLKEPEAANIFRQMVSAVQHCHSKGVVLRDIKMGRFVFVDKAKSVIKLESLEDAVLLVDPSDDNLDDKHGCPNYVSPEKAEILKSNTKYPGKATDLWALGVILYTMLVGRYPFNDSDYSRLILKIKTGTYTIPQNLSPPVSSLIKSLLQKSPTHRPDSKEILNSRWIKSHCVANSCSELVPQENAKVITVSKNLHELIPDQVVPNL